MTVSCNDIVPILDNSTTIQTDGLFEVLTEISAKIDSLTTLSLRITEQLDLFLAVGVTVIVCIVAYVILNKFSRF